MHAEVSARICAGHGERWLLRRAEERTGRLAADARAEEEISRAEREVAARRESKSRIAELEAELRRMRGLKSIRIPRDRTRVGQC